MVLAAADPSHIDPQTMTNVKKFVCQAALAMYAAAPVNTSKEITFGFVTS
jgi:hypothetical protein